MVNRIDGERRRRELAEAVWRVILRDGLSAASVRAVAQEAGLATGSVRHFFPSQSALLEFAMRALIDTVTARIRATTSELDLTDRAVAMLSELLPLTDRTHAEFAAYLEFMSRARTEPALHAVATETVDGVRQFVLSVLTDLRSVGLIKADIDPASEAVRLHALLDGLMFQLLVAPDQISRAEAQRALAETVRALGEPS